MNSVGYVKLLCAAQCPHCGKPKGRGKTFCRTCYRRLPYRIKRALWAKIGDGYEGAFDLAREHLETGQ